MTALSAANSSKDREVLRGILGAHPRLGEKKQEDLSDLSRREQAGLNAGTGEGGKGEEEQDESLKKKREEETAELKRLNSVYEEKFPGLRYVYVMIFPWIHFFLRKKALYVYSALNNRVGYS